MMLSSELKATFSNVVQSRKKIQHAQSDREVKVMVEAEVGWYGMMTEPER